MLSNISRAYFVGAGLAGTAFTWHRGCPQNPGEIVAATVAGAFLGIGLLPVLGATKVREAVSNIFPR